MGKLLLWYAALFACAGIVAFVSLSCAPAQPGGPTTTPNYVDVETQVAAKLAATLTAKAPVPTFTPTPTDAPPTLVPLPSATPISYVPIGPAPLLAFIRQAEDQVSNLVVHDQSTGSEEVLTHFVEPLNMQDVSWSRDGEWLVFVSGHGYLSSRGEERNVFVVRPDGTSLRMITGDYLSPETAEGPFVTLRGQVEGGAGACTVSAQGVASPVAANETGAFELPGVPLSARWARAVCKDGELSSQGDIDLSLAESDVLTVTIPVKAEGQGWSQVSVSRDGCLLVGLHYHWTLDDEQKQQYTVEGAIADMHGVIRAKLELPEGAQLTGVDWSPNDDQIVGTITTEKSTALWLWDANGKSIGLLVEIPNPTDEILTACFPKWSPDGSAIAFAVTHRYWWGDPKYRTELVLFAQASGEVKTLVQPDWGSHAYHPSWSSDGSHLFYQLSQADVAVDNAVRENGQVWSVAVSGENEPSQVIDGGIAQAPSARPAVGGQGQSQSTDEQNGACLSTNGS